MIQKKRKDQVNSKTYYTDNYSFCGVKLCGSGSHAQKCTSHILGSDLEDSKSKGFEYYVPKNRIHETREITKSESNDEFDDLMIAQIYKEYVDYTLTRSKNDNKDDMNESNVPQCIYCLLISKSCWLLMLGERSPLYSFTDCKCPFTIFKKESHDQLSTKIPQNGKLTNPNGIDHIHRVSIVVPRYYSEFTSDGSKIHNLRANSLLSVFSQKHGQQMCGGLVNILNYVSRIMVKFREEPVKIAAKYNLKNISLSGCFGCGGDDCKNACQQCITQTTSLIILILKSIFKYIQNTHNMERVIALFTTFESLHYELI